MNKQYYQSRTGFITQSALIAALYVVLTMIVAPIAFGPIQFRVSEVLCVLPYFLTSAVPTLKLNTRYIRSFTTMDTVLTETCSILRTHPLLIAIWIRLLDVHIPVIFSVTVMAMLSKVGLFLSSNKGGFIK